MPDEFAWNDIGQSMSEFAGWAAAGAFAVNETGGQPLLTVIHDMQDWLAVEFRSLRYLEERPPLGSSHGAEVIKPFHVQVATDANGFLTRLKELGDSLVKAEEGIKKAMDNYRKTELDIQTRFSGQ